MKKTKDRRKEERKNRKNGRLEGWKKVNKFYTNLQLTNLAYSGIHFQD